MVVRKIKFYCVQKYKANLTKIGLKHMVPYACIYIRFYLLNCHFNKHMSHWVFHNLIIPRLGVDLLNPKLSRYPQVGIKIDGLASSRSTGGNIGGR